LNNKYREEHRNKSWSSGLWLHHYTTSQSRRPRLESSSPWKPQISQEHRNSIRC